MAEEQLLPSEYYSKGLADRKPYETTAENIAKISIPYLMRVDGSNQSTATPSSAAQSFNSKLINNLKAKMGMALLPPTTSSFKLKPDATALQELTGGNESAIAKINQEISVITDVINTELEYQQIRSSMFDAIAQLIAVGSIIVEKVPKKGIMLHPLKSFIATLDNYGKPTQFCILETLQYLPEGITPKDVKDEYELYTMFKYDNEAKNWVMTQDVDGELVGQEKTFKENKLPYKYLGWNWAVGEKYHRPFADDYYADMLQIDKLAKLNTDGAVISAKSLILVDPRGNRTNKREIAKTNNGDVIDGRAEDITSFQLNKNHDFQVSNQREAEIKRDLKESFLDNGAVTRDAERVTAQEIRVMAQQLEASTLAGIYSKMSLEWSKWIVEMIMSELNIKFEAVDVDVLTGLDALGRNQESQRLDAFVTRLAQLQLSEYIKSSELISRYAAYENINTNGLIKTQEEVDKERAEAVKAQQNQMLAEAASQSLGQEGGKAAVEKLAGTQQQK